MDREQILQATSATMLMGIVALLLFIVCRFFIRNHRKNVLVKMALQTLDGVFPRIARINYRTAECVFISDRGEREAIPFKTYDWYDFRIPFLESVYAEDQEKVRTFTSLEHMRRVKEGERPSDTCIYKARQQAAGYQWMQMIIIPAGELDCVMVYVRCVDESVRADQLYKEQLWEMLQKSRDAEGSKTEFLRHMCNDLRIPLNEIIELNARARETIGQGELQQLRHCLARIESVGSYMRTMLNDICQVSIFREWRVKTTKVPFSLREVLHSCRDYCMNMDGIPKGIVFEMQLDENLKQRYNGDGSRITQLLNALLANAYQFNREGGKVLLKVWLSETGSGWDEVAISVCDTGSGIGEGQLAAIRSFFGQDRQTAVKLQDGIGLGFFFVKRALDAIDGRVYVESREGEGSAFSVLLRLEHMKSAVERAKENLKVLVVDDNEIHREIASEILTINSFRSVSCDSGEQALRVFRESEPGTFDVVLTDIEMPEMDGHQLASEIRSSDHADGKKVRIIALTVNDNDEERRKALQSGMDQFLAKPFQLGEFKQALEEWIV